MDEAHLANAVRYVSFNPVRARLVKNAKDWAWSSVSEHLNGKDDGLVKVDPVLKRYGNFREFLGKEEPPDNIYRTLRQSETTGRPLGSDAWLDELEERTGRVLKAQKRGPKKVRL